MPKLQDIGELDLIRDLASRFPTVGPDVLKGIGDDCAVLRCGDQVLLLTTDLLIENVHFLKQGLAPERLARKLLGANLSDIAAMGGRAASGLLSAALPGETETAFWEGFIKTLAREFKIRNMDLIGGDTSASPGPMIFNLVLIGRSISGKVLYRSGARVGDRIFVSRELGDSAAGLALITGKPVELASDAGERLKAAYEAPEAEEDLGPFLAESGLVTAMIDLSDGLATDLGHLVEAGGVGAEIVLKDLPVSREAKTLAGLLNQDPVDWALSGGEDYGLLFTVRSDWAKALTESVRDRLGRIIYPVGRIVETPGLFSIENDRSSPLKRRGWEHFR